MRTLPRAQDFAATLDSILGSRDDVEDITKPRPRPVPETRLREPVIGRPSEPIARAAPELEVKVPETPRSEPGVLERPEGVDRHLAISDAMREWRESPSNEPDHDADDAPKKPDPLVGADVHTGNDEERDRERRLNIARRVGGIAQAIGGIIGIVNGARFGASDTGGLGGFAASQALMGAGGAMAEGAQHRIDEMHTDAQHREQAAIAAANQLQQDKQRARDDENAMAQTESLDAHRIAQENLAQDELQAEIDRRAAERELRGMHEATYAQQVAQNAPRPHGGGGGHAAPSAAALTPENQEAIARGLARSASPDEDPNVALQVARQQVALAVDNIRRMKPNQQVSATNDLLARAGMSGTPGSVAGATQGRLRYQRVADLSQFGWHLDPTRQGRDIDAAKNTAGFQAAYNLQDNLETAAQLASRVTNEERLAFSTSHQVSPNLAALQAQVQALSGLYREFYGWGTPQAAELRLLEQYFPGGEASLANFFNAGPTQYQALASTIRRVARIKLQAAGYTNQ